MISFFHIAVDKPLCLSHIHKIKDDPQAFCLIMLNGQISQQLYFLDNTIPIISGIKKMQHFM